MAKKNKTIKKQTKDEGDTNKESAK